MVNLHLNFKKIKATEALKEHVAKRATKFEKFVTYPLEVHVFLGVEKTYQVAEFTVHAEHRDIVAVAKAKDMYESIDMAAHKIESQLKKSRELKKGHTAAHLSKRTKSLKLGSDVKAVLAHREKKLEQI